MSGSPSSCLYSRLTSSLLILSCFLYCQRWTMRSMMAITMKTTNTLSRKETTSLEARAVD